eukprot:CAMPEP_0172927402 /NCGR_PEP_ID=MMETSP1075-20121228/217435_1 /TAXON_ID=2916 /ORGANISM="Ceratium fusus, Strain PA161109" /LENGTH=112 /DNA_ID=CAMNT_0013788651 /DNA_START=481 /DNA_END=816 /DNA_ORIENTATION=+
MMNWLKHPTSEHVDGTTGDETDATTDSNVATGVVDMEPGAEAFPAGTRVPARMATEAKELPTGKRAQEVFRSRSPANSASCFNGVKSVATLSLDASSCNSARAGTPFSLTTG